MDSACNACPTPTDEARNKALDAEPPIASFLKSILIGGGPVNADVMLVDASRGTTEVPATAVIFEGFGDDSRLRELPGLTNTPRYGQFQRLAAADSNCQSFYVAVQIIDEEMEEQNAFEAGLAWLARHEASIRDLTTRRNLEVQTSLLPGDGSRALCVPPEASQLLFEFDCKLIHQCSRRLTPQEMDERGIDVD